MYIYIYKHGKFLIIKTLKLRLKEREHFWIKKLRTLTPYALNQELN